MTEAREFEGQATPGRIPSILALGKWINILMKRFSGRDRPSRMAACDGLLSSSDVRVVGNSSSGWGAEKILATSCTPKARQRSHRQREGRNDDDGGIERFAGHSRSINVLKYTRQALRLQWVFAFRTKIDRGPSRDRIPESRNNRTLLAPADQSRSSTSSQFDPAAMSTLSGTLRGMALTISCRTSCARAGISSLGASKTSSS